jgi:hypothetical protein
MHSVFSEIKMFGLMDRHNLPIIYSTYKIPSKKKKKKTNTFLKIDRPFNNNAQK